ncbi:radical SAM protein [Aliikangiella coralliicola]|uniref:Radical SAM protein n=1 Tax=Aliikangiella coralliicola TaxID=2592383 RepID=A0A545UF85_9GAMM|nr:radical SAM protein [Aliikangiella coralliicola]TQV88129.1 radical SAM protein [Aliikangiella coralliicola]
MISLRSKNWQITSTGEPRGYIQPHALNEVWFHTGTRCNLACDFCLEGASPSDKRLQAPRFEEVKPFIDEALELGAKQFSFTGGEPFLIKDFIKIVEYASRFNPCLILTNGTDSPLKRLDALLDISDEHFPISFRVSIDYPDSKRHNMGRGEGTFEQAITGLKRLYDKGFSVSVARHQDANENSEEVNRQFKQLFSLIGLPDSLNIVAFPDFLRPGSIPEVPHITTDCMTRYQSKEQRENYMCATSKMIVKKNGRMQVYACTLVDDDEEYCLGHSLKQSLQNRISLKHHRCYSCFAYGASCSEKC